MTDHTWRHWLQTRFDEIEPRLAPDGKWVAYTSDQTGQPEIWVRSSPDAGTPIRISPDGGRHAVGRTRTDASCSTATARRTTAVKVVPAGPTIKPGVPSASCSREDSSPGSTARIPCRARRPLRHDRSVRGFGRLHRPVCNWGRQIEDLTTEMKTRTPTSQPSPALEHQVEAHGRQRHQDQRGRIADDQCSSGMWVKFMPYTVPMSVGAKNIAAQAEIFLISSFWA